MTLTYKNRRITRPFRLQEFAAARVFPVTTDPHDAKLYASLRQLHTYLALLLFLTILGHLGAALFHGLIYRDGVFTSMMPWRARRDQSGQSEAGQSEAETLPAPGFPLSRE
nr:hypothetical protein Hi04_10k_c5418_00002 [uncultured bacterium]